VPSRAWRDAHGGHSCSNGRLDGTRRTRLRQRLDHATWQDLQPCRGRARTDVRYNCEGSCPRYQNPGRQALRHGPMRVSILNPSGQTSGAESSAARSRRRCRPAPSNRLSAAAVVTEEISLGLQASVSLAPAPSFARRRRSRPCTT